MLTPIQVAVLVTLITALLSVGYLLNVLPREARRTRDRARAQGKKGKSRPRNNLLQPQQDIERKRKRGCSATAFEGSSTASADVIREEQTITRAGPRPEGRAPDG